jgi:hypothetical protein
MFNKSGQTLVNQQSYPGSHNDHYQKGNQRQSEKFVSAIPLIPSEQVCFTLVILISASVSIASHISSY